MNFQELPLLKDRVEDHPLDWPTADRSKFHEEYGVVMREYCERFHRGNYDDLLYEALEGARALEVNGKFHIVMETRLLPPHLQSPGEDYVVMKTGFSALRFAAQFAGERFMDAWGR